jgi:hypothetical protein
MAPSSGFFGHVHEGAVHCGGAVQRLVARKVLGSLQAGRLVPYRRASSECNPQIHKTLMLYRVVQVSSPRPGGPSIGRHS